MKFTASESHDLRMQRLTGRAATWCDVVQESSLGPWATVGWLLASTISVEGGWPVALGAPPSAVGGPWASK